MGDAYFYHLTRNPLEATLPLLLGKARAQGWRVAVRGTDPEHMEWLNERLWLGPEERFLPHGLAGRPHAARQPVLLTVAPGPPENAAQCLMTVDGAEVQPDEVTALDRVCVLFEDRDPQSVDRARDQWRTLTRAGCAAQYWSEASGRWEKQAEA